MRPKLRFTWACLVLPDVRLSSTLGCTYATIIVSAETYCLQADLLMYHWGLLPAPPCRLWLSCRLHLCTSHCITEESTACTLSCNVSFGVSTCPHASCGSALGCASAARCIPTGWLPLHPFQSVCGPSLKLNISATATTVTCQECRPTNPQL